MLKLKIAVLIGFVFSTCFASANESVIIESAKLELDQKIADSVNYEYERFFELFDSSLREFRSKVSGTTFFLEHQVIGRRNTNILIIEVNGNRVGWTHLPEDIPNYAIINAINIVQGNVSSRTLQEAHERFAKLRQQPLVKVRSRH